MSQSVIVRASGVVATLAGLHTVVAGARSIVGQRQADPAVESELRYYSAFYVAYGLHLLGLARSGADDAAVRRAAGAVFLGGLARAGAWNAAGAPNRVQRALLAIELAGPPGLVVWQRRPLDRHLRKQGTSNVRD